MSKKGQGEPTPPYRPVALGGLWKGVTFSEETIVEACRERDGVRRNPPSFSSTWRYQPQLLSRRLNLGGDLPNLKVSAIIDLENGA